MCHEPFKPHHALQHQPVRHLSSPLCSDLLPAGCDSVLDRAPCVSALGALLQPPQACDLSVFHAMLSLQSLQAADAPGGARGARHGTGRARLVVPGKGGPSRFAGRPVSLLTRRSGSSGSVATTLTGDSPGSEAPLPGSRPGQRWDGQWRPPVVEPRGWWANVPLLRRWVGVLPQLSIDRMNTVAGPAWLEALRSDAVWYWIFNRDIYHLRDPDDMAEVARRVEDFAPPGANNKTLKIFLGDSLISLDGPRHKAEREALSPPFQGSYVQRMVPTVAACAEDLARVLAIKQGQPQEVTETLRRAALDVIGRVGFGTDFRALWSQLGGSEEVVSAGQSDDVGDLMEHWQDFADSAEKIMFMPPSLAWFSPSFYRYRRGVDRITRAARGMMERRRRAMETGSNAQGATRDVLSHLLANQSRYGMSEQQILDEMKLLLFAGVDTTAATVSAAIHGMAGRPDWQRACKEEIDAVMGDRPLSEMTYEDLQSLRRVQCVWRESLRMWPASLGTARTARHDTQLRGYDVQQGTTMVLNFWALHRHPSLWPRADEFLPERWLPEYAPTLGPSRSDALMPFNVGPHACIGATLANAEGPLLLASVLRSFSIRGVPGWEPDWVQRMTLSSTCGVHAVLRPWGDEKGRE